MRSTLLLAALAALPLAAPAAQTRVGLGVRLDAGGGAVPFSEGSALPAGVSFTVPVDIAESVRVEPTLGFTSVSVDGGGSFEGESFESTERVTTLGLTVSALVPARDVTLTAGARVRNTRYSVEEESFGGDFESRVDVLGVGPLVGGEYPFSDRFSIGAEVGLEYRSYRFDEDDFEGDEPEASGIGTTAAVAVRFFLF